MGEKFPFIKSMLISPGIGVDNLPQCDLLHGRHKNGRSSLLIEALQDLDILEFRHQSRDVFVKCEIPRLNALQGSNGSKQLG